MEWVSGRWELVDGEARTFGERGERVSEFERAPATGLTLLPDDLAQESRPIDQMSYSALGAFIERKIRNGGVALRESVERHLRVAFPLANFVIVLFGVPLSSRTRNSGRLLQVGFCLLICFVYYGCIQGGRAMGWNGVVSPFWGAWGANVLFGGIGVGLLVSAHK